MRKHRRACALLAATVAVLLAAAGCIVVQGYVSAPAALRRARQYPMPLGIADLTPAQQEALLTVQDPNFYSHPGVDLGISGGVWTTITQGLVKQFYFADFRPGFLHLGKVRQSLLAVGFNRRISKNEQLRLFINCVYLGRMDHPILGFDDAARAYYKKPFADLSREEYLGLVAAIASPVTFNPVAHPQENRQRVERIERLLKGECASQGRSDALYSGCAK